MGQIEVYEFLKAQRLSGEHKFWTTKEVEVACRLLGFTSGMIESVRGDLIRLEMSGYLEPNKRPGNEWKRAWRIKDKYIVMASQSVNVDKGDKI